jgi:hypothetical protein
MGNEGNFSNSAPPGVTKVSSLFFYSDYALVLTKARLIEYNNGFRAHMQNFFSKSTDKEAKEAYSENATLKDVQEEAIEALKKYKSDGKSWRHPLQSTGRAFSDVASRFEFLVELLPYGEYTSIACGGLKLAFNVCSFKFRDLYATLKYI